MPSNNLDLSVKGTTVQSIFRDFLDDKFEVNRHYQRKLVWTLKEKEYLINSIVNELPIPLILLAKDPSGKYEIVDGLQRLNAIIGFLRNEFPLEGKYFDLKRLGDTKALLDSGEIQQGEPVLSEEECRKVFNYELPVSIYTTSDDGEVEEVFRRINSSGRHLSRQDIRQAGATGELPSLVRRIASEIRGDVSFSDLVPLSKMGEISITEGSPDGRGVPVSNIFWVANGILDVDAIRESKDEELILDILLDVLSSRQVATEARQRDLSYGIDRKINSNTLHQQISNSIVNHGPEQIIRNFLLTFEVIEELLEESGKSWRDLTSPGTRSKLTGRYFQLIFVPLYKQMVDKNTVVADREGLLDAMDHFWDKTRINVPKGGGTLAIKDKDRIYKQVTAHIEPYFTLGNTEVAEETRLRLRNFEGNLMRSKTESSAFELKLGITDLESGELNLNLLGKLPKIASAIANTHPRGTGSIYLGVTDDVAVATRIEERGYPCVRANGFYIPGIRWELDHHNLSVEDYQRSIQNAFSKLASKANAPLLKNVIVEIFDYKGKDIVAVRFPKIEEPIQIDGTFFVRNGSHLEEVGTAQLVEFIRNFDSSGSQD